MMPPDVVDIKATKVPRTTDDPKRQCSVEGCDRVIYGRLLCQMHHRRWVRAQSTERRNGVAKGQSCACGEPVVARMMCRSCYDRSERIRTPVRDRELLCLHGGPDDRPTPPDGYIRVMVCGDDTCLEVWHCDTRLADAVVDDIEMLMVRNRQLNARLRSLEWF